METPEAPATYPVTLSPELFQATLHALSQRPWAEVAGLMAQLITEGKASNPAA